MAGETVVDEGIAVEEALTTEEPAEEELAEEEVISEASIEEELPEEITIEEVPEETAVEVISDEEGLDGELFEEAVEDSLIPEEAIEEELPDGAIEDINIQQPESVSEDEENLLETNENKDDPVLAGDISTESVSSIEFGYYPQSKVTDSYLLDLLKEESESFSYNGKSYVKKGNEWYLCEPIKWRILLQSDGKAFVMSEKILDSCVLNNKWVDSDARKWLNSTFIDQAFGEEERECIYLSGIKTGDVTTDDYLFYPSENDLKNSTYGFEKDEDRIAFGTEYSKSNDTYLTGDTWATSIERYVVAVYGWSGQIVSTMPAYAGYGARPCMYIELEKAMAISEQYNSTGHGDIPERSFDIVNDTWWFENPDSKIPVGIYRMFFEDDATAKSLQKASMAKANYITMESDFDRAISWALENGIATGYSDGTFRPWNKCSRLAVMSFLYRYANL